MEGVGNRVNTNLATGLINAVGYNMHIGVNWGQASIIGDNADVGVNNNTLLILGGDATVGTNNGHAHIVGDNATIHTNNGRARIEGHNATVHLNNQGAEVTIIGNSATVIDNHGYVFIRGNDATVNYNRLTGQVRFDTPSLNATVGENWGRIDVASGSSITSLGINHHVPPTHHLPPQTELFNTARGYILVRTNGTVYDTTAQNHGFIDVEETGNLTIDKSHRNARIISQGMSTLTTNSGYLQVGVWEGDMVTPIEGSGGGAYVTTNLGGIIRNFSNNLSVHVNISGPFYNEVVAHPDGCECGLHMPGIRQPDGGRIENYGTLHTWNTIINKEGYDDDGQPMGFPAETRFHIRRPDVSNLSMTDPNATNILRFFC
jgi:hypothetical protein